MYKPQHTPKKSAVIEGQSVGNDDLGLNQSYLEITQPYSLHLCMSAMLLKYGTDGDLEFCALLFTDDGWQQ